MHFFQKFDFGWAWLGLGASLALLPVLLLSDVFRSDLTKNRFRDVGWWAWFLMPMYMIHQFEEYAVYYDWQQQIAPFANMICQKIGYAPYPNCPIPFPHYWLVNMGLWLFVVVAASLYKAKKTNAMVALSLYGLVLANGLLHIGGWLLSDYPMVDYHSGGVITSILLFLPVSAWLIYVCVQERVMGGLAVFLTFFSGFIGHAILFGGYFLLAKRGVVALYAFDMMAMGSPLVFAWLFSHSRVGQR